MQITKFSNNVSKPRIYQSRFVPCLQLAFLLMLIFFHFKGPVISSYVMVYEIVHDNLISTISKGKIGNAGMYMYDSENFEKTILVLILSYLVE